jgi:hypothetical protein
MSNGNYIEITNPSGARAALGMGDVLDRLPAAATKVFLPSSASPAGVRAELETLLSAAVPGDRIYIPKGEYKLDQRAVVSGVSNFTIVLDREAVIKQDFTPTGGTGTTYKVMLLLSECSNIEIIGGVFRGINSLESLSAIRTINCNGITLDGIRFENFGATGDSVGVAVVNFYTTNHVIAKWCNFSGRLGSGSGGFSCGGQCRDHHLTFNVFGSFGSRPGGRAAFDYGNPDLKYVIIENNLIWNTNAHGIVIAYGAVGHKEAIIRNNRIAGCTMMGIYANGDPSLSGSPGGGRILIEGNEIIACGGYTSIYGGGITIWYMSEMVILKNNVVRWSGLLLDGKTARPRAMGDASPYEGAWAMGPDGIMLPNPSDNGNPLGDHVTSDGVTQADETNYAAATADNNSTGFRLKATTGTWTYPTSSDAASLSLTSNTGRVIVDGFTEEDGLGDSMRADGGAPQDIQICGPINLSSRQRLFVLFVSGASRITIDAAKGSVWKGPILPSGWYL